MWIMAFSALHVCGVLVDLSGSNLHCVMAVEAKSPWFSDEEERLSGAVRVVANDASSRRDWTVNMLFTDIQVVTVQA
jgi:hypothetical protein